MRTASLARDLDLNLLRVFAVVAEQKSVTEAAARLYLTQPAISAALRRLSDAIEAPLFVRKGRGLALTARGEQLYARAAPLLSALVEAATSPEGFDPATSARVLRLGLSDMFDVVLLPALCRHFERHAPHLRLIVTPVQFRTVASAFASNTIDLAVAIADELPAGVSRAPLFDGGFELLFDPRHATLGARPTLAKYLAHEHVIVSYNGDLRGVVEDLLRIERRVRVSVASFHAVGAIVEGSAMVATLPAVIARGLAAAHPKLARARVPKELALKGSTMDLLSRDSQRDDPMLAFARGAITKLAKTLAPK